VKPGPHIHWTDAENCPELGPNEPVLLINRNGTNLPFVGYRGFDGRFYSYQHGGDLLVGADRYCPIPDDVPPEPAHPGLGGGND